MFLLIIGQRVYNRSESMEPRSVTSGSVGVGGGVGLMASCQSNDLTTGQSPNSRKSKLSSTSGYLLLWAHLSNKVT